MRTYLLMPIVCSLLWADTISLGLVEEVDDRLVGVNNPFPLIAIEFALEMDHGTEGDAVLELRWDPGIPVRD